MATFPVGPTGVLFRNPIPIVVTNVGFPVEAGMAASLPHPGNNVTGVAAVALGEYAKHVELLRDMVPGLARVATFLGGNSPDNVQVW
jgi:putative ABC transport system substrate-binding protein